jgi:hypothetical protein
VSFTEQSTPNILTEGKALPIRVSRAIAQSAIVPPYGVQNIEKDAFPHMRAELNVRGILGKIFSKKRWMTVTKAQMMLWQRREMSNKSQWRKKSQPRKITSW